jgi:hypothetical protein
LGGDDWQEAVAFLEGSSAKNDARQSLVTFGGNAKKSESGDQTKS